ncbi:hypothetical protein MLD38_021517 [Melastoma candidum]|uniref:Uncharacterized protein n=1 Tax=Melastoma candidum TaxID=119954 RepID=A0ACB9QJQ5_9MYRT|nr:hypothetical protein MLD38_021517 [Melastoma candidum]
MSADPKKRMLRADSVPGHRTHWTGVDVLQHLCRVNECIQGQITMRIILKHRKCLGSTGSSSRLLDWP